MLVLALAACGSDGPPPMSTKTFGGDRPADLQTPATITPGKQYPLIVVLHGYSANGFAQSVYFHMRQLTDADKAMYIAPDGTIAPNTNNQFWNADPVCCDFENQNPDDVGYLGGLVEDILDEWPVDPKQVFFLGHSNGGYMAYRMACERADLIAGIASLAGNAQSQPSTCNPSQNVSVLHMHGTSDVTVPYQGGAGVGGVGAEGSTDQWSAKNGCTGARTTGTTTIDIDTQVAGAETEIQPYSGCPDDGAVELWRMQGSQHIPVFDPPFASLLLDWFVEHTP